MENVRTTKTKLTQREKAEIILEHIEKYFQIDHNFMDFYLKAIENGLLEIAAIEKQ